MTRQGIHAPALARRRASKFRPRCESLEGRALMAVVPGYDYVLDGLKWKNPSKITYSIAPDGVYWDGGPNNLAAQLDAKTGPNVWRREIARALQTWASVANINIVAVNDGDYKQNASGAEQGDPRFGDIRFGGFDFLSNDILASAYMPPPNLSTAGGDVEVNTRIDWNIGDRFDFYSVMLHETGHSLGLEHTKNPSVVMGASYGGTRNGLTAGDIAGIQAIYGPRTPDSITSAGRGTSPTTAVDVTSGLNAAYANISGGYSLSTIGQTQYFSIVAPAGATGASLVAAAVASGSSLLSPSITVFDASMRPISSSANPASWGNDVSAGAAGVVAGSRYYIAVTGATKDVFAVGAYQLAVSFQGIRQTPPVVVQPPPITGPTPPAVVTPPTTSNQVFVNPDRFESNDTARRATRLGIVNQLTLNNLSLHNASDVDFFTFRAAKSGVFNISAPGQSVVVLDSSGRVLARGVGTVSVKAARAGAIYNIAIGTANNSAVPSYTLTIAGQPKAQVAMRQVRRFR